MPAYSGVSAVTASGILPFNYWNVFVSQNASAFNENITAISAGLTGLSGAYTAHSAMVSGIHGMRANAGPVGSFSASGFIIQTATANVSIDSTNWLIWPVAFAAAPTIALAPLAGVGGAAITLAIESNQVGSAQVRARNDNATAMALGFGRV